MVQNRSNSSSRVVLLSDDDDDDAHDLTRNDARIISGYRAGFLGCAALMVVVAMMTVHGSTLVMSTYYLILHHSQVSNVTARIVTKNDQNLNLYDDNIVAISWEEVAVARVILGGFHLVFSIIYWVSAWIKCPHRSENADNNWRKTCQGGVIILNLVSYVILTVLSLLFLVKMAPNLKNLNNYRNLTALCLIFLCIWETAGILACTVHFYFKKGQRIHPHQEQIFQASIARDE